MAVSMACLSSLGERLSHDDSGLHCNPYTGEELYSAPKVMIRTDKAVYRAGEVAQIAILSPGQQGMCYLEVCRDTQPVQTQTAMLANGKASVRACPLAMISPACCCCRPICLWQSLPRKISLLIIRIVRAGGARQSRHPGAAGRQVEDQHGGVENGASPGKSSRPTFTSPTRSVMEWRQRYRCPGWMRPSSRWRSNTPAWRASSRNYSRS